MPDVSLPGIDTGATPTLSAPDANVSASIGGGEDVERENEGDEKESTGGKDVVLRALNRWDYVESVDEHNMKNAREDTKFAWEKGEQWNPTNREQRENAKPPRPWLEFNQTGPYVKRITNAQRKDQPSIKVRPAGGGATEEVADIFSGLTRAIEQDSQASSVYDTGLEHAVTGGRGYWRVTTAYEAEDSFNQVIVLGALANPGAVRVDPDAKAPDKSDKKWAFVCDWVDKETYEREWPEAGQAVSWDSAEYSKGEYAAWYSAEKVCVADYYELVEEKATLCALSDGRTMWRDEYDREMKDRLAQMTNVPVMAMTQAPIDMLLPQCLKEETRTRTRVDWYKVTARPEPLAKYEWKGKIVPVVVCVGDEIMIDGKRIYQGVIRRMRDAQMMLNYAFTMMVERVALAPRAPYIGAQGSFENQKEWDTLNSENHPYLQYNPVKTEDGQLLPPPSRNEPIGVDQGLVTMLQLCVQNLQAITGQQDQKAPDPDTPWRALVQSERRGDVAVFQYGDNEARAIAATGRIIIDLAPWIYDKQRAVRIVNVDGTDDTVTINQQQPDPNNLDSMQPVNDLRVGRYDCTVETGPSYATRRVEAASEMQEYMTAIGPQGAMLVGDLFAKMADWPGDLGDQVATRMRAMLPPQILAAEAQKSKDPMVQSLTQQVQQLTQQMQQMGQAAQAAIKQKDDEIATLKTKNESKRLDFVSSIMETQGKRDDLSTQRFMEAENNASQEFIAKLDMAQGVAEAMAKMGYDPMSVFPAIFQAVAMGGQAMRRGPDFSDVAQAIQAQNDANARQVTGIVAQQNLGQPDPSQPPMMQPPGGPPGGMMPPNGPPPFGGPPDQGAPQ